MFLVCWNELNLSGQPYNLILKLVVEDCDLIFVGCFFEIVDVGLNLLDLFEDLLLTGQQFILFPE